MMDIIKIYYDVEFIEKEGCDVPFLFPVLNIKQFTKLNYYHNEQVKKWLEVGEKYIKTESINCCDFVVFPKNYSVVYLKEVRKLCKIAKKHNKKVIVFYMSDVENKLPYIDNLVVYRSSLTTNNPTNEYPMPGFPEDLIKYCKNPYKDINTQLPVIGYVGYCIKTKSRYFIAKVAMNISRFKPIKILMYLFFNYVYHNERMYNILGVIGTGSIFRKNIIDILCKEKTISFSYIRREKGFGIYENSNYRKEYVDNMINSDFPLVIRGFGNFSFRLSEVISLGKIPLFIDTDCKLPFENEINYRDLFIWVPYKDRKNIGKYIKQYIKKNNNKFIQNQKRIREIYENYYTLTGYYVNMLKALTKID